MTPLLPIAVGLALVALGFATLRSFGPRYRVARLIAATPTVSVSEAIALSDGPPRYVGIQGRIDADDEFEDEHHRPLVLRRARIERGHGTSWETIDQHVEAVDFGISEGLDAIAVDHAALDVGLVVVPRESVGTAGEIPERIPEGIPADTPVRLRVDLVTAVEHAMVFGVPARRGADRIPAMTAGLGRPLILSTLDPSEAMRVLAEGGERRPLVAAVAFAAAGILLVVGVAWALLAAVTGTAAAASPAATAAAGGDPRSSGAGPGLVGEPVVAVAAVIGLGLLVVVVTLAYVRLTGGRQA